MQKTLNEFKQVKKTVQKILEEIPETRNNDKLLTYQITQKLKLNLNDWSDFKKLPNLETIRRTRQKIQENNQLLPDEKTQLERIQREKNIKQTIKKI